MKPTLSQICSLESPFEKDIEDYAAGQCQTIELWLTKLETYLQHHSYDDLDRLLEEQGVATPVASFQGGLLTSQGEARRVAWELFQKRLEMCRRVGVEVMVVACDTTLPFSQQDLNRTRASLRQAAEKAAEQEMLLALEFQAQAAFGNNLQTAAALVEEAAHPALGLCLDVFHFHVGPSKLADLAYLGKENLFHVQLSDLADTPRETATDQHRILPGDGDLPLAPVLEHLRSIQYERCVSIELMNPQIGRLPALQFGEISMTALRKKLGLTEK